MSDNIEFQKYHKLYIEEYSPKSLVLRGNTAFSTKSRKRELISMGGAFNLFLRVKNSKQRKPGWIFRISDREKLEKYVERVNKEYKNRDIFMLNITEYEEFVFIMMLFIIIYTLMFVITAFFELSTGATNTSVVSTDFYTCGVDRF